MHDSVRQEQCRFSVCITIRYVTSFVTPITIYYFIPPITPSTSYIITLLLPWYYLLCYSFYPCIFWQLQLDKSPFNIFVLDKVQWCGRFTLYNFVVHSQLQFSRKFSVCIILSSTIMWKILLLLLSSQMIKRWIHPLSFFFLKYNSFVYKFFMACLLKDSSFTIL